MGLDFFYVGVEIRVVWFRRSGNIRSYVFGVGNDSDDDFFDLDIDIDDVVVGRNILIVLGEWEGVF